MHCLTMNNNLKLNELKIKLKYMIYYNLNT